MLLLGAGPEVDDLESCLAGVELERATREQAISIAELAAPDVLILAGNCAGEHAPALCEYFASEAATADVPILVLRSSSMPETPLVKRPNVASVTFAVGAREQARCLQGVFAALLQNNGSHMRLQKVVDAVCGSRPKRGDSRSLNAPNQNPATSSHTLLGLASSAAEPTPARAPVVAAAHGGNAGVAASAFGNAASSAFAGQAPQKERVAAQALGRGTAPWPATSGRPTGAQIPANDPQTASGQRPALSQRPAISRRPAIGQQAVISQRPAIGQAAPAAAAVAAAAMAAHAPEPASRTVAKPIKPSAKAGFGAFGNVHTAPPTAAPMAQTEPANAAAAPATTPKAPTARAAQTDNASADVVPLPNAPTAHVAKADNASADAARSPNAPTAHVARADNTSADAPPPAAPDAAPAPTSDQTVQPKPARARTRTLSGTMPQTSAPLPSSLFTTTQHDPATSAQQEPPPSAAGNDSAARKTAVEPRRTRKTAEYAIAPQTSSPSHDRAPDRAPTHAASGDACVEEPELQLGGHTQRGVQPRRAREVTAEPPTAPAVAHVQSEREVTPDPQAASSAQQPTDTRANPRRAEPSAVPDPNAARAAHQEQVEPAELHATQPDPVAETVPETDVVFDASVPPVVESDAEHVSMEESAWEPDGGDTTVEDPEYAAFDSEAPTSMHNASQLSELLMQRAAPEQEVDDQPYARDEHATTPAKDLDGVVAWRAPRSGLRAHLGSQPRWLPWAILAVAVLALGTAGVLKLLHEPGASGAGQGNLLRAVADESAQPQIQNRTPNASAAPATKPAVATTPVPSRAPQPTAAGAVPPPAAAATAAAEARDVAEVVPPTATASPEPAQADETAEPDDQGDDDPSSDKTAEQLRAQQLADRGFHLLKSQRLALAEKAYLKSLELFPRYPRALSGLTRVHLERRDGKQAVRWAKRLVSRQRSRAANRLLLGDAWALQGNKKAARSAWSAAARMGSAAARKRLAAR